MIDALTLWQQGLDTAQIAHALHTKEHVIYNALAKLRKQTAYYPEEWKRRRKLYSNKLWSAGIRGNEYRDAMAKFMGDLAQ